MDPSLLGNYKEDTAPRPAAEASRVWYNRGMSRIAIAGSSGLVGHALVRRLEAEGHHVLRLVRGRADADSDRTAPWDPSRSAIDPHVLDGCDAVVNLAGESISRRWTKSVQERILSSRVAATRLLANECARLGIPALVNASAIGIYGDRGDQNLDESSPCGGGFLADTCVAWEHALHPAREAGVRTVACRFGLILAREGGALPRMVPVFRAGLGGPIGGGRQWISWIHLDDAVGVLVHALNKPSLDGAVLATSPHPVRQADFAATLAAHWRRKACLPLPRWMARLALGRMADELLLSSQRCTPHGLGQTDFVWRHPDLTEALDDLLR